MERESFFFETNFKPFAEEIENAASALNSIGEEVDQGMYFLLKDTLNRIAKEIKTKVDFWEKEFEVYKKLAEN